MSELPDPPVPADTDLQDFPFMPLHVARLRDSDLAAEESPEACWYAVLLWAASWHQLPAGSLPDNDRVLMKLVDLGRDEKTWKKHRDAALRGFVRCSDGRLYHSVVCEQVKEAWDAKLRQKHRTFCAAVRKHNERNPKNKLESPSFDEWIELGRPGTVAATAGFLSRVEPENVTRDDKDGHAKHGRDNGSNRQGQGQGQGQGDSIIGEPKGSLVDAAGDDVGDLPEFELRMAGGESPPEPPKLEPQHIVEAWNLMAGRTGLPKVVKLSDERRKACKARIAEYALKDFQTAISAIERSSFLREGSGTWRGANFDFLIQKSTFLKLIEGQYDQKPAAR